MDNSPPGPSDRDPTVSTEHVAGEAGVESTADKQHTAERGVDAPPRSDNASSGSTGVIFFHGIPQLVGHRMGVSQPAANEDTTAWHFRSFSFPNTVDNYGGLVCMLEGLPFFRLSTSADDTDDRKGLFAGIARRRSSSPEHTPTPSALNEVTRSIQETIFSISSSSISSTLPTHKKDPKGYESQAYANAYAKPFFKWASTGKSMPFDDFVKVVRSHMDNVHKQCGIGFPSNILVYSDRDEDLGLFFTSSLDWLDSSLGEITSSSVSRTSNSSLRRFSREMIINYIQDHHLSFRHGALWLRHTFLCRLAASNTILLMSRADHLQDFTHLRSLHPSADALEFQCIATEYLTQLLVSTYDAIISIDAAQAAYLDVLCAVSQIDYGVDLQATLQTRGQSESCPPSLRNNQGIGGILNSLDTLNHALVPQLYVTVFVGDRRVTMKRGDFDILNVDAYRRLDREAIQYLISSCREGPAVPDWKMASDVPGGPSSSHLDSDPVPGPSTFAPTPTPSTALDTSVLFGLSPGASLYHAARSSSQRSSSEPPSARYRNNSDYPNPPWAGIETPSLTLAELPGTPMMGLGPGVLPSPAPAADDDGPGDTEELPRRTRGRPPGPQRVAEPGPVRQSNRPSTVNKRRRPAEETNVGTSCGGTRGRGRGGAPRATPRAHTASRASPQVKATSGGSRGRKRARVTTNQPKCKMGSSKAVPVEASSSGSRPKTPTDTTDGETTNSS